MSFLIRFLLTVTGMTIFGFGVEFNVTGQSYDVLFIIIGATLVLGPIVYDELQLNPYG